MTPRPRARDIVIGVISDTHGLVRPEALEALGGSDLILHAGDVGRPDVLEQLAAVAPLRAVRGNVDVGPWADALPAHDMVEVAGTTLYLLHNIAERDEARMRACHAVVFGHSHKPRNEWRDGVLHFNPGSAGPRRFRLPIAVGRLRVHDDELHAEIRELSA